MILVAGSANLDFVVKAQHIPAPGETVLGREFNTYPGGKGANQAVACARAGGATTHMLLALGDDVYAHPLEKSLLGANVKLHSVRGTGKATGTAFICVSDEAENAITVAPGANMALQAADLPSLQRFSHLLMQLEIPIEAVTAYAAAARGKGLTVALNAAPAQRLPAELLDSLDVLIVNEGELLAVTQVSSSAPQRSIAQALDSLTVPCVVVTLGAKGCCARVNGQVLLQPAFDVKPVDTTGAGDTFCGVLVAWLQQGFTWPEALAAASAAGALACTEPGAQSSIPTAGAVEALLATRRTPDVNRIESLNQYCGFAAST